MLLLFFRSFHQQKDKKWNDVKDIVPQHFLKKMNHNFSTVFTVNDRREGEGGREEGFMVFWVL